MILINGIWWDIKSEEDMRQVISEYISPDVAAAFDNINSTWKDKYKELEYSYDYLKDEYDSLECDYDDLESRNDTLQEEIDEIKSKIDETLDEFITCPGGNSCFVIDGKEYHTDTGYAIEGIKFFVDRLNSKVHS